jgi:hypothetical protein
VASRRKYRARGQNRDAEHEPLEKPDHRDEDDGLDRPLSTCVTSTFSASLIAVDVYRLDLHRWWVEHISEVLKKTQDRKRQLLFPSSE